MKKSIIVLLVAVLAASLAFAGVTGSASFSAGYDLDEKQFTVNNSKTGKGTFTFDFAADSEGSTVAVESGIYAKIAGSYKAEMNQDGLKGTFKLTDATIQAVDGLWSVNLTKVANGVEVTYDGNAVDVYYVNGLNWGVNASTKAFTIIDGLTVKASAGYAVALNDLADPANYTYGFDAETSEAIAEAKKDAGLFAKYDDGTYKDPTLAAAQDAVADAEKAVKDAKAAFAEDPTAANKDAIGTAEKAVKDAKAALAEAEAEAEAAFKQSTIDDGKDYYKATTKYSYSEKWTVVKDSDTDKIPTTYVQAVVLPTSAAATSYYIFSDYSVQAVGEAKYNKTVIATVTNKKTDACKAYLVAESTPTTTYADNKSHYEFAANPGTATVNGGLEVAYAADKISASVAANVAYETVAKEIGYDVTVKGGYDFVSATVKYDSDKVLDASAAAKLDEFVGMPLSVSFGVTDALSADAGRAYNGEIAVTVAGATLKGTGSFKTVADAGYGRWAAGIEASYAMDFASFKFTAKAMRECGFGADHNYAAGTIAVLPTLEVTNTTLIQNATLALKYAGAQFGGANAAKGAVTATIGVKF